MVDGAMKPSGSAVRGPNRIGALWLSNRTPGLLFAASVSSTLLPTLFGHASPTSGAHASIGGLYAPEWVLIASNASFLFIGLFVIWLWTKHVQLRGPWAAFSIEEKTALAVGIVLIAGCFAAYLVTFVLARGHWPASGQ